MQPLTIVTGILLGSSASIALGLVVVLFIFVLLSGEHPRLKGELDSLLVSTGIFVSMTAICAASFVGLLRRRTWRWAAQAAMWVGVALVVVYFLPEGT